MHGSAGPFERRPALLPASLLEGGVPAPTRSSRSRARRALAEAVGFDGQWVGLGMPGVPDGTLVVGSPGSVSADGLVALRSLMNQVLWRCARARRTATSPCRRAPTR